MGRNAIHEAAEILGTLRGYQAREPEIDGLRFREGLNAVGIRGGVAGNVIPDECVVTINYRFAPDRSAEEAAHHVREVFAGWQVTMTDSIGGARPGLGSPAAASFAAAMGGQPRASSAGRCGQVRQRRARVNFGPGDPSLAHSRGADRLPRGRRRAVRRGSLWYASIRRPARGGAWTSFRGPE